MHSSLVAFSENNIARNLTGRKDVLLKPYLRVSRAKDSITLEFEIDLQATIRIYSKRGNESDYVLLGETDKSPFVDTRVNLSRYSELRQYKAIYLIDEEPLGEEDFVEIKTKGRFRFF